MSLDFLVIFNSFARVQPNREYSDPILFHVDVLLDLLLDLSFVEFAFDDPRPLLPGFVVVPQIFEETLLRPDHKPKKSDEIGIQLLTGMNQCLPHLKGVLAGLGQILVDQHQKFLIRADYNVIAFSEYGLGSCEKRVCQLAWPSRSVLA
jgi:hypothetical protein